MSAPTNEPPECLNCQAPLYSRYCADCGQAATTHRYTVRTFVTHDLVHSLWHVDKSILRTVWNVARNPGAEAKKNIAGKRAGQFPVVTLVLLVSALCIITTGLFSESGESKYQLGSYNATEWIDHNFKWILISLIPLFAVSALLFFRRARYNLAEHLIAASYLYCGTVIVFITMLLVYAACTYLPDTVADGTAIFLNLVWLAYIPYAYWQMFKEYGSVGGWIWRFAGTLLSAVLLLFLIILLVTGLVGGFQKGMEFELQIGTSTTSPVQTDSLRGH